jgi:hypothetical protein
MTCHYVCKFLLIAIFWITWASSKSSSKTLEQDNLLESLSPVEEFNIIKPDDDNGQEKISAAFKASINSPDVLDTFLKILQETKSPVSSVLDLRSLLVSQKEEKIELENGLRQMSIEMQGIRLVFQCLLRNKLFLMSGLCHLDRASNVEIGVECQIFVIVIIFKCDRVLQFGAHSRY